MTALDYEILSRLMRYVFALLGVVIVWRTYAWLRRDRRDNHRRLRALPDAGAIGVMTVLRGSSELPEGTELPIPPEGVMGFVRTCDVVVPVTDVVARHLDFSFRNGKGLYIYPRRGCQAAVDGVPLMNRADCRRYPMQHGSTLAMGEALLQLGVFAGLDVQTTASLLQEPPTSSPPMEPLPSWADGHGSQDNGATGYGVQPSAPTGYGVQPSASTGYGVQPSAPTGYGAQPSAPTGYGVQPSAPTGYGVQPSAPTGYGVQPSMPTGYGVQPSAPTGYGVQLSAPTGYGVQPSAPTGYPPRPWPPVNPPQRRPENEG